jgi:hypothetical protein
VPELIGGALDRGGPELEAGGHGQVLFLSIGLKPRAASILGGGRRDAAPATCQCRWALDSWLIARSTTRNNEFREDRRSRGTHQEGPSDER